MKPRLRPPIKTWSKALPEIESKRWAAVTQKEAAEFGAIWDEMVDRAPKKARLLQNQGLQEKYVRDLVIAARNEIAEQNVRDSDPNRQRMVREIAMANALEEASSDDPAPETM